MTEPRNWVAEADEALDEIRRLTPPGRELTVGTSRLVAFRAEQAREAAQGLDAMRRNEALRAERAERGRDNLALQLVEERGRG